MVTRGTIHLTIILRNRAEYHLILSRRGRRPSWLNQGIFREIEQDNCLYYYSTNSHGLPFLEREKLRLYDKNAKS